MFHYRGYSHPCWPAHYADQRPGWGCHSHNGGQGGDQKSSFLVTDHFQLEDVIWLPTNRFTIRTVLFTLRLIWLKIDWPELSHQVDPSGCYDNLVTVRSFVPHYSLVGGVNLPKIIDCVGSDGRSRRQLVKVGSYFSYFPLFPRPRTFDFMLQMCANTFAFCGFLHLKLLLSHLINLIWTTFTLHFSSFPPQTVANN